MEKDETEHLMKGENGKRLKESISELKKSEMEEHLIKQLGLKEYEIASAFTDMSGVSEGIQTAIKKMYVLGFTNGYKTSQELVKTPKQNGN